MPGDSSHNLPRKGRVHITYDVETYGSPEKKELPFVVGVMGDFSVNPTEPLKSLKDRKFTNIDRDNFNEVMATMKPGLQFKVENTLQGDGSEFSVNLDFQNMEDFEPGRIVDKVEPLKNLLETRNKLRDLLAKADIDENLERELEGILESTEKTQQFLKEAGINEEGGE